MTPNPPHHAFHATGNRFVTRILYIAYVVNETLIRSEKLEQRLWDMIKIELFYIGGHCQHSGNCCRGIMLFHDDQPIIHQTLFDTVQRKAPHTYQRFIPEHATESDDSSTILCFNCQDLGDDNRCKRYESRPTFCQRYPLSSFLKNDALMTDCGYKLLRTRTPIPGKNKSFTERLQSVRIA